MKNYATVLASLSLCTGLVSLGTVTAYGQTSSGYIYYNGSVLDFIQVVSAGNSVQGKIIINSPNAPGRTAFALMADTYNFSGIRNGSAISLRFVGSPEIDGHFTGSNLILDIPQTDGSLEQIAFKPASVGTYNRDLAALKKTFSTSQKVNANETVVDGDLMQLPSDQIVLSRDYSSAAENLKALQDSVQQAKQLLAEVQNESKAVMADLGPGKTDWTQFEYHNEVDAASFENANTDYGALAQNVISMSDLDLMLTSTTKGGNLTDLSANQMARDISTYEADYKKLLQDESKVPFYHPSTAIASPSTVATYVKAEQDKSKTYVSVLAKANVLRTKFQQLLGQVKQSEKQVDTAITNAVKAAQAAIDAANSVHQATELPAIVRPDGPGTVVVNVHEGLDFDPNSPTLDSLSYVLVNTPTGTPDVGELPPASAIPLQDFSDVKPSGARYLDLYDLDKNGKVIEFLEVDLSTLQ